MCGVGRPAIVRFAELGGARGEGRAVRCGALTARSSSGFVLERERTRRARPSDRRIRDRVERPSPLLRIAEPRDHTRRARVMYANDIVRFQTGFKQAVERFRSSRARRVPEGRTLRPREGRIFSFFSYLGDEAGYFLARRAVHHLWPWPAWASPPASLASQCSWSSRMSPIAMAPTANARSLLTSCSMFFEPCENMCTVAQ